MIKLEQNKLKSEFKIWMQTEPNLGPASVKSYSSSLSRVDLGNLKRSLSELKEKEKSNTYNQRIFALRNFAKYLKEKGVHKDLIKIIDTLDQIPNNDVEHYQPYPVDEVKEILSKLKGWHKQAVWLAMNAGLRRSEIQNLNVDDIDYEQGWITVTKGKGKKRRKVAIAEVKPLQRWKKYRDLTTIIPDEGGSPWLYTSKGKRPKLTSSNLLKKISGLIGQKFGWHRCRATFATALYHKSQDIVLVQEQMGHASIETTRKYIAFFSTDRASKIRDLGGLY